MKIYIRKSAIRDLKKIDGKNKEKIISGISELTKFPEVSGVKKLTNFEPSYRLWVGDYRILFDVSVNMIGSSVILMEKKFHFTAPLDCHVQLATVKEYPCSITFEASKPSGSRL
jgi:mRNA interferase RelE/StbE